MISEYNFRNFNFRLLFCVIALNVIGVLVINSAVNGDLNYTRRQLIGLFGGLLMALIFCLINYHYIMKLSWIVYLGCIGILAAVMLTGQLGGTGGGSRRWITLPVLGRLQPSEFVKICPPVSLSRFSFFVWFLSLGSAINGFSARLQL